MYTKVQRKAGAGLSAPHPKAFPHDSRRDTPSSRGEIPLAVLQRSILGQVRVRTRSTRDGRGVVRSLRLTVEPLRQLLDLALDCVDLDRPG